MSVYVVSAECIVSNGCDSVEVYRQSYSCKAMAMEVYNKKKGIEGYRVYMREIRL